MKYIVCILILLCGCSSKKQIKEIELPFEIITPGYFDVSTIPDSNKLMEIVTLVNNNLHSIEISIRDSFNPQNYRYFKTGTRDSSSSIHYRIGDTSYSVSSDGINKFIFKNGNSVWSMDFINTERMVKYSYRFDTLIETGYERINGDFHSNFENKYLFDKGGRMVYSSGLNSKTFRYKYNSKNEIINIEEIGLDNQLISNKNFEYFINLITSTQYFQGEIEETDTAYFDNFGKPTKTINVSFYFSKPIMRTKLYFYDSIEPSYRHLINDNILSKIKY